MAKFRIHNSRVYLENDTAHKGPSVSLHEYYKGKSPMPQLTPRPKPTITIQQALTKLGRCPGCTNLPEACLCAPATLSNMSLRVNAVAPAPREAPRRLLECDACHRISCLCPAPSMQTFEAKRVEALALVKERRGW